MENATIGLSINLMDSSSIHGQWTEANHKILAPKKKTALKSGLNHQHVEKYINIQVGKNCDLTDNEYFSGEDWGFTRASSGFNQQHLGSSKT